MVQATDDRADAPLYPECADFSVTRQCGPDGEDVIILARGDEEVSVPMPHAGELAVMVLKAISDSTTAYEPGARRCIATPDTARSILAGTDIGTMPIPAIVHGREIRKPHTNFGFFGESRTLRQHHQSQSGTTVGIEGKARPGLCLPRDRREGSSYLGLCAEGHVDNRGAAVILTPFHQGIDGHIRPSHPTFLVSVRVAYQMVDVILRHIHDVNPAEASYLAQRLDKVAGKHEDFAKRAVVDAWHMPIEAEPEQPSPAMR